MTRVGDLRRSEKFPVPSSSSGSLNFPFCSSFVDDVLENRTNPFSVYELRKQQILTFPKHVKVLFTFLYVLFAITSVSFRDELARRRRRYSMLRFLSTLRLPRHCFRRVLPADDLNESHISFRGISVISCRAEYGNLHKYLST